MIKKLKVFFKKSKRVWMALKKPSKEEFEMTAKVSGIGIGILGLIGFVISMLVELVQ